MTKYKVFVQETRTIMLEVEAPNDIEACNLVNEDINKYPVIDEEVTFWEVDYAEEIDNVTNEIDQPKVTITPQELEGDISTVRDSDYADKVDTLVDKMGMRKYKWDEQFYNEIVKDSKFSYGKFSEVNYPLHLQQS